MLKDLIVCFFLFIEALREKSKHCPRVKLWGLKKYKSKKVFVLLFIFKLDKDQFVKAECVPLLM